MLSEDFDKYLNPGKKTPIDMCEKESLKKKISALEKKYDHIPKEKVPHEDVGDWYV